MSKDYTAMVDALLNRPRSVDGSIGINIALDLARGLRDLILENKHLRRELMSCAQHGRLEWENAELNRKVNELKTALRDLELRTKQ